MTGPAVRSGGGVVASPEPLAAEVGVCMLRAGGNAADAGVAVALALAVTLPSAGNLGGGGFWMWRGRDGRASVVDYRETAPRRATRTMYLDIDRRVRTDDQGPVTGWMACAVPGTPAGLERAWKRFGSGRIRWRDLVAPALQLARDGFLVTETLGRSLALSSDHLSRFPSSRAVFLRDGAALRPGETLIQTDLAWTLGRLAEYGARDFYAGQIARRLSNAVAAGGGLVDATDLAQYRVRDRSPLPFEYRGNRLFLMPPPSSGGIAITMALRLWDRWGGYRLHQDDPARAHCLVEAMRRAFADRAHWLGDPDFVRVPVGRLTATDRAARWAKSFERGRATPSTTLAPGAPAAPESPDTTHFTIVDGEGNCVSNTYTLNGNYGSAVVADGTGVLLNNEMDDFASAPGIPNQFGLVQSERNAIGPGRRPLSSMSPTIVEDRNGNLRLALGSPGGPTIINSVLQTLLLVLDRSLALEGAVASPRLHHQWLPDEVVLEPGLLAMRPTLEGVGHRVAAPRTMGDIQAVVVAPDRTRIAVSDPRAGGMSAGT